MWSNMVFQWSRQVEPPGFPKHRRESKGQTEHKKERWDKTSFSKLSFEEVIKGHKSESKAQKAANGLTQFKKN